MAPRVFVLVLNWNGGADTVCCLETLFRLDYPDYRVVVLDNGSTDGSPEEIRRWARERGGGPGPLLLEYDRVAAEAGGDPAREGEMEALPPDRGLVLIHTGANLGYAGGNNVGLRYALRRGADYAWILNNDTAADRGALKALVEMAEKRPDAGFFGSKLLYCHDPQRLQAAGGGDFWPLIGMTRHRGLNRRDDGSWDEPLELFYVNGASLLVRMAAVRVAGLMDESFFLYCEEADWQIRARKLGWKSLYCPGSRVWHREGASLGMRSPVSYYYNTRNSLWLLRRYYKWALPTALLFNSLRALLRLIEGHREAARELWRGVWEGLFHPDGGRVPEAGWLLAGAEAEGSGPHGGGKGVVS